jgi:hypothetical protein
MTSVSGYHGNEWKQWKHWILNWLAIRALIIDNTQLDRKDFVNQRDNSRIRSSKFHDKATRDSEQNDPSQTQPAPSRFLVADFIDTYLIVLTSTQSESPLFWLFLWMS